MPGSRVNTTPAHPHASKLVDGWARTRVQITPWAYPRLRAIAALRFAVAIFLTGLGAVMLARGYGNYGIPLLAVAALHYSVASLDLAVVRSGRKPAPLPAA